MGGDVLVRLAMLRSPTLRAGLTTMSVMMLTLGGVFFVLPLYLQIVLGKDPLETGVHILPLSVAVFFVAMGASRLSTRVSPRRIVRAGMLAIIAGSALLLATVEPELKTLPFSVAMAVIGVGIGAMASQLANVNLSAVDPIETSEVGGLQGTAQNLGTALGTALIGSVHLTSLSGAFDREVGADSQLPAGIQSRVATESTNGLPFVPTEVAAATAKDAGLSKESVTALSDDYDQAQIGALKIAIGGVVAIVLLGLLATRHLPARPLDLPDPVASAVV